MSDGGASCFEEILQRKFLFPCEEECFEKHCICIPKTSILCNETQLEICLEKCLKQVLRNG